MYLELIDGIIGGSLDENGEPLDNADSIPITIYKHDQFSDLCWGPHVNHTGEIDPNAVKIISSADAYLLSERFQN